MRAVPRRGQCPGYSLPAEAADRLALGNLGLGLLDATWNLQNRQVGDAGAVVVGRGLGYGYAGPRDELKLQGKKGFQLKLQFHCSYLLHH